MSKIILAEKPKQAQEIKEATGVKTISAVGHLTVLQPRQRGWKPPYFDLVWKPRNKTMQKRLDDIIIKLSNANEVIVATDYDREGQLIAYNLLKESNIRTDVQRMKFSSLEHNILRHSYENTIPFDINIAKSAMARHYLDWYFGMNISKALTIKMKESMDDSKRKYFLTPTGRVQSPVLHILSEREKSIINYISSDEWIVYVYGMYSDNGITKTFDIYGWKYDNEKSANQQMSSDVGIVKSIDEMEISTIYHPPNKDYVVEKCLSVGINSDIVDKVLQDLYLDGYISYPRTISQNYTSHGIDTAEYLKRIDYSDIKMEHEKNNISELREEDYDENPHPAIYPINHYYENDIGKIVWKIIAESFIKCHLPPEITTRKKMEIEIGNEVVPSWDIPMNLSVGDVINLSYKINRQKSSPPRRYREDDLYSWMVREDIGTVDTRTQILSRLMTTYVYQTNDGLFTSSKGIKVIDTLADLYPDIITIDLTNKFEKYIDKVQRTGDIQPVLQEAKVVVSDVCNKIKG